MVQSLKKLIILPVVSVCMTLITGCGSDEDNKTNGTSTDGEAKSTLLVYIAGDNSLSSFADENVKAIAKGLLTTKDPFNLVVYKDDQKSTPILFQLKRNESKIDTIVLNTYTEMNSVDTTFMASVINETFERFDTDIKGLDLWSHAMSWIPKTIYTNSLKPVAYSDFDNSDASAYTRSTAYFGVDGKNFMDIWDLRRVLEKCPHLDFIFADACHMATAEVAYELKDATDYLLASPTEIIGDGFPYDNIMSILATINSNNVETKLTAVAKAYMELYNDNNGCITLIKSSAVDDMATAYRSFLEANAGTFEAVSASPSDFDVELQHFGRSYTGATYYFYDMVDVVETICNYSLEKAGTTEERTLLSTVKTKALNAIDNAVIYEDHNDKFIAYGGSITLATCCGLGISLPQMFPLTGSTSNKKLTEGYSKTGWWQTVNPE